MDGGISFSVINSNNIMLNNLITSLTTLFENLDTFFADNRSMQYFVEKVKYL